jgi:hypothetical protein
MSRESLPQLLVHSLPPANLEPEQTQPGAGAVNWPSAFFTRLHTLSNLPMVFKSNNKKKPQTLVS